ncbi:MAG: hypothetical protein J5726_06045 [Treponema sp.]|nr:hypothetical protein [Treponema sp.]
MKKNIFFILITFIVVFSISLSACASKPADNSGTPPAPDNIDIEEPETNVTPQEEQTYVYDEDAVEVLGADDELTDDEYLRSIAGLDDAKSVSKKEFEDDKHEILEIISELAIIMETKNTLAWLNYIDEPSKEYYKNPVNLRKAQRKLPNKLIELKNIGDYFLYVFIPSRKNSHIDEIRYVSKTHVKAVQVREDTDAIYYEFKKENGKWLIYLPPVS